MGYISLLITAFFIVKTEIQYCLFSDIHKHKHKHIVIVKGEGSNVAVGDNSRIIHQGQVNNEGQGQISDDDGHSDIEEEVSGSQITKDSEVSGTDGDTDGNSDSSSSENSVMYFIINILFLL